VAQANHLTENSRRRVPSEILSMQLEDDRPPARDVPRDARSSRLPETNFRAAPPVPRVDFFVKRFEADFQRL
jgi:hypothetical protein